MTTRKFSNIRSLCLFIVLGLSLGWLLLSCGGQTQQPYAPPGVGQPSIGNNNNNNNNGRSPRRSSRNERNCREDRGSSCEGDSVCEDICDDIFSKSKSKAECKELSAELVDEFDTLFYMLKEEEDLESINHQTLDCLLDISETEFIKEVGRLGSGDTKTLLQAIAEENELAEVIGSEDKDYKILEKLLGNFNSDDILQAFEIGVDGSDTFIELIIENENDEAWEWVTEYVSEQCENSSYCTPANTYDGNRSEAKDLVFFCKIFKTAPHTHVRELVGSELFSDNYGDFIESLSKCGAGSVSCRADQDSDFLGGANTVCNHIIGITVE